LTIFGANPETFPSGDTPLLENFVDFQALILPPKG
jgi:hypothetical protein